LAGVLVAVLGLFVFPTRSYLDQRRELSSTEQRIRILAAQNAALSAQVDKLHTDAEIERIAREQYHLVKPGEQAFAILPAPVAGSPSASTAGASAASTTPTPTPLASAHHGRGFLAGLWHRLTSWL
jgi:hypothetical protein